MTEMVPKAASCRLPRFQSDRCRCRLWTKFLAVLSDPEID
uniref:Uncharacterized protein n=1 Tax=Anguilla anguilla TaxID=7936 RepID=A0A0E9UE15_ANGAN